MSGSKRENAPKWGGWGLIEADKTVRIQRATEDKNERRRRRTSPSRGGGAPEEQARLIVNIILI